MKATSKGTPVLPTPVDPVLIDDLVAASRILAEHGVVDAYGHVSMRHPTDPDRYLMSRLLAPELVTAADIMEFNLDSDPIDEQGRSVFLERFIHGEIYKVRSDVNAIVHSHSPSVIPFGVSQVPMKPLYLMSAFLYPGVPVFEIRKIGGTTDLLVRNPELGHALADSLGDKPVVLMRGHGNAVVATSVPVAVFRAIYTEINARLQMQAIGLGGHINYLEPEEGRLAEASMSATVERPWELWKKRTCSA